MGIKRVAMDVAFTFLDDDSIKFARKYYITEHQVRYIAEIIDSALGDNYEITAWAGDDESAGDA